MEKNINKYLNEMKLTGGFIHTQKKIDSIHYKPIKMSRDDLQSIEKLYVENCALVPNFGEL